MVFLSWLIKKLNDSSDTFGIDWILSIVTIKISYSLIHVFKPVSNHVLNLDLIHDLNIINMSISLSLNWDQRRKTFRTLPFGKYFMSGTVLNWLIISSYNN